MGLTLRELYGIIAGEEEGNMTDKYVLSGSLALRAEALGGHEIGRLKPEDIAGNIAAATLLHQQALTSIWELHEAREEISLLREERYKLMSENASLREVMARYEEVQSKGYVEILLSAILGFGMAEAAREPLNPIGWIILGLALVAILCSILPRLVRRKGEKK